MGGVERVDVVVHGLGHAVGHVVGDSAVGHEEVGDGRGGHGLGLAAVGVGRDRGGLVGRVTDLGHHIGGHGDHHDLDRGGQVTDRGHAQAGRLQRGVQLAVLHQLDRLAKRQVLHLGQIAVGQAGGLEDGARVQFGARLGRAHRNALALEVGQGLDARVGAGDDLDVVVVGGREAAQLVQLLGEARFGLALPGVGQGIGQRQGQLAAAGLQQVEVLGRGLGDLGGGACVGDVLGEDLRQRHAQRVVHAALAAGEHVDELLLLGQGAARDQGRAGRQQQGAGTHEGAEFFHACLQWFLRNIPPAREGVWDRVLVSKYPANACAFSSP
ncbi:hypothetical protein FQZ97_789460 [compost metagenome]